MRLLWKKNENNILTFFDFHEQPHQLHLNIPLAERYGKHRRKVAKSALSPYISPSPHNSASPSTTSSGFIRQKNPQFSKSPDLTSSSSPVAENQKLLKQLKVVLHARDCLASSTCMIEGCSETKTALVHISTCMIPHFCFFPLCSAAKEAINHFQNCHLIDCSICLATKKPTAHNGMSLINYF